MRNLILGAALVAALSLGACSKAEQKDTQADVKAAADRVAAEAKDAANSPEVKEAAADVKGAAKDAGSVAKDAAGEIKQGFKKAGDEIRQGPDDKKDVEKK
jgi:hypothetical protein